MLWGLSVALHDRVGQNWTTYNLLCIIFFDIIIIIIFELKHAIKKTSHIQQQKLLKWIISRAFLKGIQKNLELICTLLHLKTNSFINLSMHNQKCSELNTLFCGVVTNSSVNNTSFPEKVI